MKKRFMALLLAVVMVASCLPVNVLAEEDVPHIHCYCGEQKTLGATCENCGKKAVEWTATDVMPTAAGHYYLTKGVSAEGVEYSGAEVAICLHGQNITSTNGGQILAVTGGAVLTVTDCAEAQGQITGATSYVYGAAIRVKKGGTMVMYGGKVADNKGPSKGEGTIYLDKGDATTAGGVFYMYGGQISGNTNRRGAGIFSANATGTAKPATIYILGGTITGNEAKGTGNTKGGGGIHAFCPVYVGGNAVVSGNTAAEGPADIYLRNTYKGQLIVSADVPLTGGAKIGVGSDTEATDDPNNITCITGAPTQWSCDWMTYAGASVSYVNGKFVAGHYHGDQLYTPISNNSELSKATGYGYLTTDLNLGGEQTRSKDLNLCLNGHTITAKKGKRVFTTAKNAGITFAIEDCSAYTDAQGVYHAGKLTGGSNTGANGGGAMYLAAGNTLHLYDGILTGNTATVHGGALTIMGDLHLHGGQVTGNSAGGIYVDASAKVYVDGDPFVYDNKQDGEQNNLYLAGSTLLTVGQMAGGAKLGISAEAGGRAISGACDDYSKYFVSDSQTFKVLYREGALFLDVPLTHVHCICGSASCTEHESIGFTEWKQDDALPGSGNYCLTQDVTLTKAVAVNGELNLCLNGHTITQTGADRLFKLDVGPLSITDCGQGGKLVGGTNDYGAAIVIMEGTTFNLYGGKLSGSQPANPDKAGTGAAIFLRSSNAAGATFNMYGGEITENGDEMTWGGAITNGSGSAANGVYVNIYGGKIYGNTAGTGGAIRMENKSVLTVSGGEITGNTATGSGGAIYLAKGAQLDLRGGQITGNTAMLGGGIFTTTTAGNIQVSGAPAVTDNTVAGKQNNLYLNGDLTVTLGDVAQEAKIGITAAKGGRAISSQSETDHTANFVSDSAFKSITYQDKVLHLADTVTHAHCVCNGAAQGCSHEKQVWDAWESSTTLPTTSGYYYLTEDVVLSAIVKMEADQKIFLCLNGKTVTAAENTGHMILTKGTELSITDCNAAPGGFTGGNKAYGGVVNVVAGATLNLYGGELYGNTAPSAEGGAVYLQGGNSSGVPGGIFNMYGGKIRDNTAGVGGAIRAAGLGDGGKIPSVVNIYGGEITGNKTLYKLNEKGEKSDVQGEGAAIAATLQSVVNIYGGTIQGNIAEDDGGAIYANNKAQVYIKGGKIANNEAKRFGGAVFTTAEGTATVMEGGELTGNKSAAGGAAMLQSRSVFTLKGGKISGNTVTGSGAGLYVSTNTDFVMTGGEISGNTAVGSGGAAYVLSARITVAGGTIKGNTALSAGAVFLLRSTGEFTGGTVSGNHAKGKVTVTGGVEKTSGGTAGAVYVSGAKANMRGTSFVGNKADTNGGAVVLGRSTYSQNGVKKYSDAQLNIYGGTFSGNTAGKVGGAMLIQSQGTVVNVYGGTFTGNTAKSSAGAIYASTNTTFHMTGGSVVKNHSDTAGGGIYLLRCKATITGGEIGGNTAASSGGQLVASGNTAQVLLKDVKLHSGHAKLGAALVVQSQANFTAENCDIYDNSTETSSGAAYVSTRTEASFVNCKFYNNQTKGSAGALTASNFSTVNITGCDFTENTAGTLGGALCVNPASLVTVKDSTFNKCSAGTRGGAITCKGSMFLIGSVIENCTSKNEGGAVYTDINTAGGSGVQRGMVVEGSQIRNNTSGGKGGAFYVYKGCRLELYDSQITGNTAPAEGGAIWAYEDLELHNTQITGNASGGEGYAVYKEDANYDGHSYTASVNKLSGSTVIKDNQGGDLWMGKDVVFAIAGEGLGKDTHINLTMDSGVVTSRILGAYHYEGGNQVYTVTYGDRSMTDPEVIPGSESAQEQKSGDVLLYAGVGVFALAVIAVVILLLGKKKAKKPAGE